MSGKGDMMIGLGDFATSFAANFSGETPIPIKVVVVTMFEIGEDTGDRPGEFQTWVEQLPLREKMPFPHGYRDLRYNREKSVLGIVTGIGTARAAASVMALGMDPRFDLSRAYWLVAGIAGVNPNEASIGSAAWAEWVIDSDLGFELDAREKPAEWSTGFIPLGKAVPYEEPLNPDNRRSGLSSRSGTRRLGL
jgi:purine nucleoside permease